MREFKPWVKMVGEFLKVVVFIAFMSGLLREPIFDVVCLGSYANMKLWGFISRKASIITLPFTL